MRTNLEDPRRPAKVIRYREYLKENFGDPLRVNELDEVDVDLRRPSVPG